MHFSRRSAIIGGAAAASAFTRAKPLRRSLYLPMPDGVRLALDVLRPRLPSKPRPTALIMTRYWRSIVGAQLDPTAALYVAHGFNCVVGDVRGTGASFGRWPYHRSRAETLDFSTVMDWIVAQPWSDGRIVGVGSSYTANTADWMAERRHPALRAIVPRYADFDPYEQLYFPGGAPNAFMGRTWGENVKKLDLDILVQNGRRSPGVRPVDGPEGARLLKLALAEHAPVPSVWRGLQEVTYRDDRPASWGGASMNDWSIRSHAEAMSAWGGPMQTWAGWRDAGTAQGAIERFLLLPIPQHVIIGPWSHGGVAVADPFHPELTSITPDVAGQDAEDLRFVDGALAGAGSTAKRLDYYVMGASVWRSTRVWPPAGVRTALLHLGEGGELLARPSASGVARYSVDFDAGSGRATRWTTNNDGSPVHYGDRADADRRLLCFTAAPLTSDLEITGHPAVRLQLISSRTDGLVVVYLEAVSPNGSVAYITEGVLRLLHRKLWPASPFSVLGPQHSFLKADGAPMRPGETAAAWLTLQPVSVRVPAAHRLRVAIGGADRDTFARVPAAGDAALSLLLGGASPSMVALPILGRLPMG